MTTLLLDTHIVHWWSAEPDRLSRKAASAVTAADELAVAAISWWELAWLATNGRIVATGTHSDLLRTDPRYAATLHQMEEEEMEAAAKSDDRDAPSAIGADLGPIDELERN